MVTWRLFLRDFDARIVVSNWNNFCNIEISHENMASTLLLSAVIKKVSQTFAHCGPQVWGGAHLLGQFIPAPPQLVFNKHDELFPNHQNFLTICHITVQNTRQLCDNRRNISGGHTIEWNLPLLTPFLSGDKTSAIFLTIWCQFLRTLSSWDQKWHTDPW